MVYLLKLMTRSVLRLLERNII